MAVNRALWMLDNGAAADGIVLLECQLLGALMLDPTLRLYDSLQTLRPADFASQHRGLAFQAIMAERHPELGLVADRLDRDGHQPPHGRAGWGDALSRLLDVALVDDDSIPVAARRIREAAIARRSARRSDAA